MRGHFVVMWDAVAETTVKAFLDRLKSQGWGWARYFGTGVLVTGLDAENPQISAKQLVDMFKEVAPGIDVMALEVDPKTWAYLVKDRELVPRLTNWLKQYWE